MAVAVPLPCRLTYVVGEPLYPPATTRDGVTPQEEQQFAHRVSDAMRELIGR
jgi:hypothetical protein